jgi:hypothetical protein
LAENFFAWFHRLSASIGRFLDQAPPLNDLRGAKTTVSHDYHGRRTYANRSLEIAVLIARSPRGET